MIDQLLLDLAWVDLQALRGMDADQQTDVLTYVKERIDQALQEMAELATA
jgi:hypothetical protein